MAESKQSIELSDKQKEILQHCLGADSRYKKKEWGFRNFYMASKAHVNFRELKKMTKLGMLTHHFVIGMGDIYSATELGCRLLGFTKVQITRAFKTD